MCCRLQTLVLSDNNIDAVRNVECCRQLWCIDLSGNRVGCVAHSHSNIHMHVQTQWSELTVNTQTDK